MPAADPNVSTTAVKRLSGQKRKILDMLIDGPAILRDILSVASKHASRISDFRKAGFEIECRERPGGDSPCMPIRNPGHL